MLIHWQIFYGHCSDTPVLSGHKEFPDRDTAVDWMEKEAQHNNPYYYMIIAETKLIDGVPYDRVYNLLDKRMLANLRVKYGND